MSVSGRRVTVTTTATLLSTATVSGQSIAVTNKGAAAVDLGGSTVATGAGYSLAVDATASTDLDPGEELYAIAASGTVDVHVLETGV